MKELVLYKNKKVSWNWLSFQFIGVKCSFSNYYFNIQRYFTWRIYQNHYRCIIFPFYFFKNNCEWELGISLFFLRIQLKYQFK